MSLHTKVRGPHSNASAFAALTLLCQMNHGFLLSPNASCCLVPWCSGAAVFVAHRDASDSVHGHQLAHWLHNHLPAVQMYSHAAGLLGFDLIPDLTPQQFGSIVQPKVKQPDTDSFRCRRRLPSHICTSTCRCRSWVPVHCTITVYLWRLLRSFRPPLPFGVKRVQPTTRHPTVSSMALLIAGSELAFQPLLSTLGPLETPAWRQR